MSGSRHTGSPPLDNVAFRPPFANVTIVSIDVFVTGGTAESLWRHGAAKSAHTAQKFNSRLLAQLEGRGRICRRAGLEQPVAFPTIHGLLSSKHLHQPERLKHRCDESS